MRRVASREAVGSSLLRFVSPSSRLTRYALRSSITRRTVPSGEAGPLRGGTGRGTTGEERANMETDQQKIDGSG